MAESMAMLNCPRICSGSTVYVSIGVKWEEEEQKHTASAVKSANHAFHFTANTCTGVGSAAHAWCWLCNLAVGCSVVCIGAGGYGIVCI